MAVLGKRKARSQKNEADEDANDIFRRHFEARFMPIAETATNPDPDPSSEDSGEESEWGGLSDEDDDKVSGSEDDGESDESGAPVEATDEPVLQVVDHSVSQAPKVAAMSKREMKAFMSSRPPDQADPSIISAPEPTASPSTLPEDAPSLLKQDLELRRLISESHLLSSPALGAAAEPRAFAAGRIRQKTTDMRLQALGAKTSILKQEKMPMNMRKGITAAAGARESKRRREAKENGIVLEREAAPVLGRKAMKEKRRNRREQFSDGPGVGRMRGAQLSLSERDVKKIEGGRDVFGRKGR